MAPTCSHQLGLLSGRVFLRSQCESLGRDILQTNTANQRQQQLSDKRSSRCAVGRSSTAAMRLLQATMRWTSFCPIRPFSCMRSHFRKSDRRPTQAGTHDEMEVLLPHMMSAELPTPVHSLISEQSNIQARERPACAQTCVIQAAKTGTTRRLPGRGAESVESECMGALLHSPVLRPTLGAAMVPAAFATLHTKASNQLRLAANSSQEA